VERSRQAAQAAVSIYTGRHTRPLGRRALRQATLRPPWRTARRRTRRRTVRVELHVAAWLNAPARPVLLPRRSLQRRRGLPTAVWLPGAGAARVRRRAARLRAPWAGAAGVCPAAAWLRPEATGLWAGAARLPGRLRAGATRVWLRPGPRPAAAHWLWARARVSAGGGVPAAAVRGASRPAAGAGPACREPLCRSAGLAGGRPRRRAASPRRAGQTAGQASGTGPVARPRKGRTPSLRIWVVSMRLTLVDSSRPRTLTGRRPSRT